MRKRELKVGTVLCDMYYGIKPPLKVISQITICCDGTNAIAELIKKQYHDKMLVIVGDGIRGNVIAMYSYDSVIFGIIELEFKSVQEFLA